MRILLLLLAIAGAAAVLAHLGRTLLHLAHGGVQAYLAGDAAGSRARSGDVTGLQDALSARSLAVRRRRLGLAAAACWLGLLVFPPLTPWPAAIYAAYSLLWILPRARRPRA
jgi:hypothetical protein